MKVGRTMAAILGLVAVATVAPASAQERVSKVHFGGSIGTAQYQDACDVSAPGFECNDRDDVFRVFAGYRMNRNIGFEVAYVNLGQVSVTQPIGTYRQRAKGWDYSGMLSFPITSNLYGFGRLGGYTIRTTNDVSAGETNTGFTLGAGAGYDLGFLGVRVEWQRYQNVGAQATGEDSVDVLSGAVLIRF